MPALIAWSVMLGLMPRFCISSNAWPEYGTPLISEGELRGGPTGACLSGRHTRLAGGIAKLRRAAQRTQRKMGTQGGDFALEAQQRYPIDSSCIHPGSPSPCRGHDRIFHGHRASVPHNRLTLGFRPAPADSSVSAQTSASRRSGERPEERPKPPSWRGPKSHISSSSAGKTPAWRTLP
jgi:hypothetical protein